MGAKFTKGDSVKTTRTLSAKNPLPDVRTASHVLEPGSTMPGMPSHIKAGQSDSRGSAQGGKGVGPKREGPIGHKGGSGAKKLAKAAPGMSTKSYKSESTGHPGRLEKLSGKARMSTEGRRKTWVY
jgi:hypothetical protein